MNKILFLLMLIFLVSCSNYSSVVKTNLVGSQKLLIQAPEVNGKIATKKSFKVIIDSVSHDSQFPEKSFVKKEKTFVLPLVVWTSWDHISTHNLGKNQIDGSIFEYFKDSFEQGLLRKGYVLNNSNPDVVVTIKPSLIESSGTYEKDGFFYFFFFVYGYGLNETMGPYRSSLKFEIETTIFGKSYANEILGESMLDRNDFESEITELGKISKSLELAVKNAVHEYLETLPTE